MIDKMQIHGRANNNFKISSKSTMLGRSFLIKTTRFFRNRMIIKMCRRSRLVG